MTLGGSLSLLWLNFFIHKIDTFHPILGWWQWESDVKTVGKTLFNKVHVKLLLLLLTLSSINLLDFSKWSQQWKGTCESKKEQVKQKKASSHKHAGLTSCIWALKTAQEDNWKDWIMTWATPCGSEYNAPPRWEYIQMTFVNGMNNYINV